MLKHAICLLCLMLAAPAEARVARHKPDKHAAKGNEVTRSLDPEAVMQSLGDPPGEAEEPAAAPPLRRVRGIPLPPVRPDDAQQTADSDPDTAGEAAKAAAAQDAGQQLAALPPEGAPHPEAASLGRDSRPAGKSALMAMIERHAAEHGIPVELVHRVVMRESRYNPSLHHSAYWGLMQIRPDTARSMGYQGPPSGLLDAETNLTYAVPYLANAYMVAGGNLSRAVSLYAGGYYYEAKRKKLLGKLHTAKRAGDTAEAPR